MEKNLIRLGLVGTLTFFVLFVYFYKTSGKFRRSIIAAFVAVTVFFSIPQAAHSIDSVDGFTTPLPQHQSRPPDPNTNRGLFARKPKKDGPGPGKPNGNGSDGDDDGIPKFPKPESVEETEKHLFNIEEQIKKLDEVTDSDSETEEDKCQLESKAGFKELPDGKNFLYDMDQGSALKKQAKIVLRNPKAKKELLSMLNKFDDKNAAIHEKSLNGLKHITELKNSGSGPRIFIYREGKNQLPKVIGFCMRRDLDPTIEILEKKYK